MDERRFLQLCGDLGGCTTRVELDDMWRALQVESHLPQMTRPQLMAFCSAFSETFPKERQVSLLTEAYHAAGFGAPGKDVVEGAKNIIAHVRTRLGSRRDW
jgi:hypothetical protein